ncbi:hypothetical protein E2542_SST18372 [Spatholobus suberectus]|nr:hypothetical protein E2542_SST18372 [Spatholobus suberectus]
MLVRFDTTPISRGKGTGLRLRFKTTALLWLQNNWAVARFCQRCSAADHETRCLVRNFDSQSCPMAVFLFIDNTRVISEK